MTRLESQPNGRDDSTPGAATPVLLDPTPAAAAPTSISPSVYAAAAEAISSPDSGPYTYPYQPPDPSPPPLGNPYFMAAMSPSPGPTYGDRPPPSAGMYASFGQASTASANATEEDLSYAMRGMNLASGAGAGAGGATLPNGGLQRGQQYSPEPYGAGGRREMPARQDSATTFQPYYIAAASPYMAHVGDMYASAGYAPAGPAYYVAAAGDPNGNEAGTNAGAGGPPNNIRRDSITPQWGLPMPPFALPTEFMGQHSRQGSFSCASPAIMHVQAYPQGSAGPPPPPTSTFGGANSALGPAQTQGQQGSNGGGDENGAGTGSSAPYHSQPQHPGGPPIGQQHQIILGRGVRGQEYVAPGPMAHHGYGMGYAPDLRQLKSPLLQEFRNNRNRSWELQVRFCKWRIDSWRPADRFAGPPRQDLQGYIVEFSGDQLGSRHIQTKLDSATLEEKAMVFGEILPNMLQLSTDLFANCAFARLRFAAACALFR